MTKMQPGTLEQDDPCLWEGGNDLSINKGIRSLSCIISTFLHAGERIDRRVK